MELMQDHQQYWNYLWKEAQTNSGQKVDVGLPLWEEPSYLNSKV